MISNTWYDCRQVKLFAGFTIMSSCEQVPTEGPNRQAGATPLALPELGKLAAVRTSCIRQSELSFRTSREAPKDEVSVNAQLLTRAGFVDRVMAGVYSYLPLGIRVLNKIENIVRQEMDKLGSQEIFMPALHPKELWEATGRWNSVNILYKLKGAGDRDLALGCSHEEIVTPLVGKFVQSYKDLPASVYQVQTKFRNEARAKSGILRGREFRMKDMYSFHRDQADLDQYYDRSIEAYMNVFRRCGINHVTFPTIAGGGIFSDAQSHEFQTITPYGEDVSFLCRARGIAINSEVFDQVRQLPDWQGAEFEEVKSVEVGNIYKLGTKYSEAFQASYVDDTGAKKLPLMGCYGIGTTRLMGTVVEVLYDKKGMVWPIEIAPYGIHLVSLFPTQSADAEGLFSFLQCAGIETLYDDRTVSTGQKLNDADLFGLPYRVIISPRSIKDGGVEVSVRSTGESFKLSLDAFKKWCTVGNSSPSME
jgi:prolyl-tRNA synthetase